MCLYMPRVKRNARCFLLTYSQYVSGDDSIHTSWYDTIKGLVDHLYTLKGKDGLLLEYAVGVTESHELQKGQWHPNWHCHVLVWGREIITSEAINLWKFKGCCPHEKFLPLCVDSGGFPPLMAICYFKKEADAWEARYGNLTEEFLQSQDPTEVKEKRNRNEDFTYAMEAPTEEEFYARLRERQPRDLAMGFNSLKQFAKHHYKDASELPSGVCTPKELK
ncbi:hypothetical protein V565_352730, partial [Rhizoctonia solani 123E]